MIHENSLFSPPASGIKIIHLKQVPEAVTF